MIRDLVDTVITAAETEFSEEILFIPYASNEYLESGPDPHQYPVKFKAIVRHTPKSVLYAKRHQTDPSLRVKTGYMEATVIASRFEEARIRIPQVGDHIMLLRRSSEPELLIVAVDEDGKGRIALHMQATARPT